MRMINWTTFGVSDDWVQRMLAPVCKRYATSLHRVGSPGSLEALLKSEVDWDLLFLGGDALSEPIVESMEAALEKICHARPLNSVVAVTAGGSAQLELALHRAGAMLVLTMEATAEQIDLVVNRAVGFVQARHACFDQEKMRVVGHLAVSVNHEINNPLTGLMGTAELLLLEKHQLSDKVRRDLQTIVKQCHRIQEVTMRLKTLNHLRTVPYGSRDQMIDLIGEIQPEAVQAEMPASDEQFLPTPHILVVDDNPLIIDLVSRLFEQRFTIEAAAYASDALTRVERIPFDLILIDVIMPEMNGLELFRAIRRMRPEQKALLATAYHGDPRVEQAISEGALGCIYKPFKLEELESAITEALHPGKS